jgi:hypothetical protein
MDLSTVDILVCLGAIALLAAAVTVINAHRSPPVEVEPDGRHHLPPGLIDGPTARLSPETLAKLQQAPKPHE